MSKSNSHADEGLPPICSFKAGWIMPLANFGGLQFVLPMQPIFANGCTMGLPHTELSLLGFKPSMA